MLMTFGDTRQIQDLQWYMLELRSEKTAGPTLKRLGKLVPQLFEEFPVEIFIPIHRRDHEAFEIKSDCLIFVHSDSFEKVRSLRSVIGIAALMTEENSRRPVKVPEDYVRPMINEAREAFHQNSLDILEGHFVRILDGDSRDYCGHVLQIRDGRAQVRVVLKGRMLLIDTPTGNLVNLNHVEEDRRVYYYCDLIEEFITEMGDDGQALISPDLEVQAQAPTSQVYLSKRPKKHRSRHETVTALVRHLLSEGEQDMLPLTTKILEAIKADRIKKPRTAHIIYSIVKRNMVDTVFAQDTRIKTFRDVLRLTNSPFSLQWVEDQAARMGISFEREV